MPPTLIVVGLLLATGSEPRQIPADPASQGQPDASPWVPAEVGRLKGGHSSPFFDALIEAARPGNREGLTPAMLALVEQADRAAVVALRSRLDRALAVGPAPLDEPGYRDLKAKVVGHAEAIVLEAVLIPRQALRWKGRASRPTQPPSSGRYSTIMIDYPDGHEPKEFNRREVYSTIHQQSYEHVASDLFGLTLGYDLNKPTPDLSAGQVDALKAQDALARAAEKFWRFRDIGPPPGEMVGDLPATPAMMERITDLGRKRLASIVGHAEAIALDAILSPERAEQAKLTLWRDRGIHALLDPELADRLSLTKAQRSEVAARLTDRVEIYHKMIRSDVPLFSRETPEAYNVQWDQYKVRIAAEVAELDRPTWQILRPSQIKAMARLLDRPIAGSTPPPPRAKSPRD